MIHSATYSISSSNSPCSTRVLNTNDSHSNSSLITRVAINLQHPLWKQTQAIVETCYSSASTWQDVAIRAGWITSLVVLPLTLSMYMLGMAFKTMNQRFLGSYTHELNNECRIAPFSNSPFKILTLNACMFPGPLPIFFGGLEPAEKRLGRLAQLILSHQPKVVILQEVCGKSALDLIDHLKPHYRHFFYELTDSAIDLESGLFMAANIEMVDKPQWVTFSEPNRQNGIQKGFFIIPTQECVLIATHLYPLDTNSGRQIRANQLQIIEDHIQILKQKFPDKPIILTGDLNIERSNNSDCEYYFQKLSDKFFDPNGTTKVTTETATHSDEIESGKYPKANVRRYPYILDYCLIDKETLLRIENIRVNTLNTYAKDQMQSLSDHRGLLTELVFK